jgi:hypothetical protein
MKIKKSKYITHIYVHTCNAPNLRVEFFFLQHSPNSGVTFPLSFSSRYVLFFSNILARFSSGSRVSKTLELNLLVVAPCRSILSILFVE